MRYIALVMLCLLTTGCLGKMQLGVQDAAVERQIARANDLSLRYKNKDHGGIEKILLADLKDTSKTDTYARQHILNELADLYSYSLLDIERAIEMDTEIIRLGQIHRDSDYQLRHEAANNLLLFAREYRDTYLNMPADKILDKAGKRLQKNRMLLKADPLTSGRTYARDELLGMLKDVKDDLQRSHTGTAERFQLMSRLIRIEYELYRATKETDYIAEGFKNLLSGDLTPASVHFSEIDFLSLSDYLDIAYRNSRQLKLAEYALELTYRPYLKLRDHDYRWLYNKLVNTRINTLIEGNYLAKDYPRMLYYISLNKSRMILEDKVRADSQQGNIIAAGSDFFDPHSGLPRFETLANRLKEADNYLDFYINGHYDTVAPADRHKISLATAEATASFAGTRAIKRGSGTAVPAEILSTDSMYVSLVQGGAVTTVVRIDDKRQIHSMQERLDAAYEQISNLEAASRGISIKSKPLAEEQAEAGRYNLLKDLKMTLPETVTVSPDGFLSRYPLDWLFNRRTVRTLNLFTYGDTSRIKGISMVGYFNPSISAPTAHNNGDLPDAEKELDVIRPLVKDGRFFLRKDASLANLAKPIERNILHLSMHGADYADNPVYSKLLFAGSTVNPAEAAGQSYSTDDANALYARDMDRFDQLRNNDLVFTAACQTGLTKKSTTNQSEILGILRPLLINNNRNIILTLWPVESESAAQFVKSFYTFLAGNNNVRDSFFMAQEQLKAQYRHPAFWAPYYLVQNR